MDERTVGVLAKRMYDANNVNGDLPSWDMECVQESYRGSARVAMKFLAYTKPTRSMTIREKFAAMAMQGLFASDVNDVVTIENGVVAAVKIADALIAELAKEPTP